MKRIEIIDVIGKDYLTSNIENEELSYQKALKEIGKDIADYQKDDYKSITPGASSFQTTLKSPNGLYCK